MGKSLRASGGTENRHCHNHVARNTLTHTHRHTHTHKHTRRHTNMHTHANTHTHKHTHKHTHTQTYTQIHTPSPGGGVVSLTSEIHKIQHIFLDPTWRASILMVFCNAVLYFLENRGVDLVGGVGHEPYAHFQRIERNHVTWDEGECLDSLRGREVED